MEVKTIKGINEETWTKLKVIAAKNRLTMGKLINSMIEQYEKNSEEIWNKILKSGKILSDKEAEDMQTTLKESRKNRGFRNVLDF